jgi:hypothetical protein
MKAGGKMPGEGDAMPNVLDFPTRDASELIAKPIDLATPEQRKIDERIAQLEEQAANATSIPQQQALRGAINQLRQQRQSGIATGRQQQPYDLGQFQRDERLKEIESRQGEIAQALSDPELYFGAREELMKEGQALTREQERLSKTPAPELSRLRGVAPPKGRKDEDVRLVNGMLVDAQGNAITDPATIEQALTSSPKLTRDLTLAGIDEQLKQTRDPMERATLQQARAQAELDYLANKPKDKERNWKDFFLGVAMGALRGYASGGLWGAVGGAGVGGVGSVINPNFDDMLVDETFRKPQAQARLAAATEAQTNALAMQEKGYEVEAKRLANVEKTQTIRGTEFKFINDRLYENRLYKKYLRGEALTPAEVTRLNREAGVDSGIEPNTSAQPQIIRNENGTISLVAKNGLTIAAFDVTEDGQRFLYYEPGKEPVEYKTLTGVPLKLTAKEYKELNLKLDDEIRAARQGQEVRREQFQYGLSRDQYQAALKDDASRAEAIPRLENSVQDLEQQQRQAQATLNLVDLQWRQRFPKEGGGRLELADLTEAVDQKEWQRFQRDRVESEQKLLRINRELENARGQLLGLQDGTSPAAFAPSETATSGTGLTIAPGKKAEGAVPASVVTSYLRN